MALVEMGSTTTGPLVTRSCVPQSKIYPVLEALLRKGLVNYIIVGKTRHYQGVEPEKALALFKERERELESILQELSKRRHAKAQSVELFSGYQSIRNMLVAMIHDCQRGENFYGFSTGRSADIPDVKSLYEWWGARKSIAGLKDHLLISSMNRDMFESAFKDKLHLMKGKLRYSSISFPGDVALFRDNVVILNWGSTPIAVIIKSEELSLEYQGFFKGLWKGAVR